MSQNVLREIAQVAGEAAAASLAAQVGGTRVYIPARCSDTHWLVACVGRRAADLICAHFCVEGKRGAQIEIPITGANVYARFHRAVARRVHQLDRENKSAREIARAVGLTERAVRRHRALLRHARHTP